MPRRSTVFFVLCLSFVGGVAAHSIVWPGQRILEPFWWYILFLIAVVSGIISFGFGHLRAFGFWCLGFGIFALGLFRYAQTIPRAHAHHVLSALGKDVKLEGVVDALPNVREKTISYVVQLQNMEGKLLVTADSSPAYRYGDLIAFICTPTSISEYEQYAVREGVNVSCAFPEHIALIGSDHGSRTFMKLLTVRSAFEAHLKRLFSDPYGGLLSGILYGDTSELSRDLKDTFRITGLAHITALSGYNITIISFVLMGLLISLGFWKTQAMPIAMLLILAFVFVTGAEASVVRAAVMGFLVMAAKGVGRLSKPRNALALAGAVMLAINPKLLRFDLGFLLSFLATIALLYFSSDIAKRTLIRKLPSIWNIRESAAASCAVLLFTTPVILWKIGVAGPFALLTNILVVPIVPAAMALGFVATLADFCGTRWGSVFLLWRACRLAISLRLRNGCLRNLEPCNCAFHF